MPTSQKVQVSFEAKPFCPSSIGKSTRFGPMGLCNPLYNFATTFVWLFCAPWKSAIKCSRRIGFPLATSTISNVVLQSCSSKLICIRVVHLWIDLGGVVIMWGFVPTCGLNRFFNPPCKVPFNDPQKRTIVSSGRSGWRNIKALSWCLQKCFHVVHWHIYNVLTMMLGCGWCIVDGFFFSDMTCVKPPS